MKLSKTRQPVSRRPRRSPRRTAFNYYSGGRKPAPEPTPNTSGRLKKTLRLIIKKMSETLTLLAILAVIIYSLIVNPTPKVVVSSTIYHPVSTYQQALVGPLHSLRNRDKISFDASGIVANLQKSYPEISSGSVHLPLLGQRPTVQLQIAEPSFKLLNHGQTYLVNNQGVVVANADHFSSLNRLPLLDDQTGYNAAPGQAALDSASVSFINVLLLQLKKAKVAVKSLVLPSAAQELDLATTDRGYKIKFYLGGDVLLQAGQYLAARHRFDKTGQPAHYLDVRIAGKVYYK